MELMITIVVAAIVLALAIPSFRTMIQNNRITAQANELVTALSLARSEAIKRGSPVTVCASDNQSDCNTADWTQGWILFTDDETGAGAPMINTILRVWGPLDGAPTITTSPAGVEFVRYLGSGQVGAVVSFTHTIPDCKGDQVRVIGVALTGRTSVTRLSCPP